MGDSAQTTYESVLHALKHETDLTKLCGQLYNLTTLYRDKSKWQDLEKYEAKYSEALSECKLLQKKPEKTPSIQVGEKIDLSDLVSIKKLSSDNKFDKNILVFLRHLA